jgi:hypothetical protein
MKNQFPPSPSTSSDNKSESLLEQKMEGVNSAYTRIGIHGVRLKKFEEVVCDCVNEVLPSYLPLPDLPSIERIDIIKSAVVLEHERGYEDESKDESLNKHLDKGLDKESSNIHEKINNAEEKNEFLNTSTRNGNDKGNVVPSPPWPFNILPQAACVRKSSKLQKKKQTLGKLSGMSAVRKEWQLRSMIQCLIAMLPSSALGPILEYQHDDHHHEVVEKIKIVDFGGGTGHLALPIALLLPKCEIILVDLKATSLELVHEKAKDLTLPRNNPDEVTEEEELSGVAVNDDNDKKSTNNGQQLNKRKYKRRPKPSGASRDVDVTCHSNSIRQCKYIKNLYTYHGSISKYAEDNHFDIGLSLHCCGEGTDLVLRACGNAKARFIVSPCCVGKLSSQKRNPYVYHATSANEATVTYPQSSTFCKLIPTQDKFDSLAKAADYSDVQDMRTSRNATRRTAKALLESDRLLFMKERYQYDEVVLTRMKPWEASPKNDILLGWFYRNEKSITGPYDNYDGGFESVKPCVDCNMDIEMAINQLVQPKPAINEEKNSVSNKILSGDDVDWNREEIQEYANILHEFIQSDLSLKRFPTRMGSRKRKLVHFLAEKMKLLHWCEGKKVAEKIVVIAKKKP